MPDIVVVPNIGKTWSANAEYVFQTVEMSDGTVEPALYSLDETRGALERARKDKRDVPPRSPRWMFWRRW